MCPRPSPLGDLPSPGEGPLTRGDLSYLHAVILGVVEGLTEFLPVSSTGHLTITEKLLGLQVDDPAVTAYTAVIQLGAIAATLIYFFKRHRPLRRRLGPRAARRRGARGPRLRARLGRRRRLDPGRHRRLPGARPHLGPAAQPVGRRRALILWSVVMVVAERLHAGSSAAASVRGEHSVRPVDGLVIGLVQCFSLIPGVSRSGATISAGLVRGIDRVTATRLTFFLAIPALTAAGLFQAVEEKDGLSASASGRWSSASSSPSSSPTPRSPGCCASSRATACCPFVWYRVALGVCSPASSPPA